MRRFTGPLLCLSLATTASCGDDGADEDRAQPTTTAPSTTESQQEQDERELRQLAEDWFEALRDAYVDGADVTSTADKFLIDPYRSEVLQQIQEFRASGDEARRNADGLTTTEVQSIDVSGDDAVVTECTIDADIRVDGDTGEIDDDIVATLVRTEAVRHDGDWRLAKQTSLTQVEGQARCASE